MIVKTTPELAEGDIVHAHGMRVLIDGTPTLSKVHAGGNTFYHRGLVLNPDEVQQAGFVPMSWLYTDSTGFKSDEPRWTIQGNKLARWWVDPVEARTPKL